MIINNEHKIAFIHIPRTAGTSIQKALFDAFGRPTNPYYGNNQHTRWSWLENNIIKKLANEYLVFFCVREPVERINSALYFPYINTENLTPRKFIRQHGFAAPQSSWTPIKGSVERLFILRFENLFNDWETLKNEISIDLGSLPHRNKRPKKAIFHPPSVTFSKNDLLYLKNRHKGDYERFGYSWGFS